MSVLRLLDIFFTGFHIVFIIFFIFGWIYPKTRNIHLGLVILVTISWFILGLFYGFGYCFLTDIHWRIKMALGEEELPVSFIKYILDKLTGYSFDEKWVDYVTLSVFLGVLVISLFLFFQDRRAKNMR